MIQGERIRLRPLQAADIDTLHSWANDPAYEGEYNNFGLTRDKHLQGRFEANGCLESSRGMLAIETLTGELAGTISYRTARYGPNEGSIHYALGINLASVQRGKGYGSEAQKLLADYLFKTYPIMRVEAATDVTNIAEQRALTRAGFTREVIVRKAQWRGGEWHDIVIYSKLRGE
ncbi:GNAT family N-acetyltransferase [Dictyobacter aurantiacus]|uniref:Alanine acetyltransferase n=1 Tax=Dictyobacter aurantiacus TaxID=1936993 RepID=A0A401ZS65_9CHLR|nr:GNAT family protein [Dictyobacter aurantiacus]GCE09634.1 alanine acetyltransferase [Dictyobacter aurantiacus]